MHSQYYFFAALPMEFVNNREKPQNKLVVVSSSLQRITMQFAFSVSFIRLGTAYVISRLHAMTPFRFQTAQRPRCVTATLLPPLCWWQVQEQKESK